MASSRRNDESRRDFLEQIGFGAGAISLFGAGFLSVARDAGAQACAPPGPPGTAKAWRRDNRPIRQRKAASTLSSAEVKQLRDAYKAMRDLSASGIGITHTQRLEVGSQFIIRLETGGTLKTLLYTVRRCDASGTLHCIGAELVSVLRPDQVPKEGDPAAAATKPTAPTTTETVTAK